MKPAADSLRVLRIAGWMWIIYLACLVIVDLVIYAGTLEPSVRWYHLMNATPALIFLALSYIDWSANVIRGMTAALILIISGAPILVPTVLDLKLPPAPLSNLEGMVLRQLPVLMIGLVLVAWHYPLIIMVLYSVTVNFIEIGMVVTLNRLDRDRLLSFAFVVTIRMVSFIVVGVFINQLITYLRAQQAALQTANKQLTHYASTLETLTVSRERNRMSRELHDTVVHTLSGLAVQLETTKAYLHVNPETAQQLLDQSLGAARSGLQETRRALKALRASPLDDLGFVLAVRTLMATAAERGKLALAVSLPDQPLVLSPEVEQCLYRIIQEAVENVVHHANAQHLGITLSTRAEDAELVIQDDGIGFDLDKAIVPGHFGLAGMKERAELIGGRLTIASKSGSGTTIRLVIEGHKP